MDHSCQTKEMPQMFKNPNYGLLNIVYFVIRTTAFTFKFHFYQRIERNFQCTNQHILCQNNCFFLEKAFYLICDMCTWLGVCLSILNRITGEIKLSRVQIGFHIQGGKIIFLITYQIFLLTFQTIRQDRFEQFFNKVLSK